MNNEWLEVRFEPQQTVRYRLRRQLLHISAVEEELDLVRRELARATSIQLGMQSADTTRHVRPSGGLDGDGRLFPFTLGHLAAKHEFSFHAARRGLASNLFDLGVDDLTVSRILRHGGVQVTRKHYIHLRDAKVDGAMAKLAERYGNGTDTL